MRHLILLASCDRWILVMELAVRHLILLASCGLATFGGCGGPDPEGPRPGPEPASPIDTGTPATEDTDPATGSTSGTTEDTGTLAELTDGEPLPWELPLEVEPLVLGETSALTVRGLAEGEVAQLFRGAQGAPASCPVLAGGCLDIGDARFLGSVAAGPDGSATLSWLVPPGDTPGDYPLFQATSGGRASPTVMRRLEVSWPPAGPWQDPLGASTWGSSDGVPLGRGVWMDLYGDGYRHFAVEVLGGQSLSVVVRTDEGVDDYFALHGPDGETIPDDHPTATTWIWRSTAGDSGTWSLRLESDYWDVWGRFDVTVMLEEPTSSSPWYLDADGDGFGDPATEVLAPVAPPGHVSTSGDCDDGELLVHPGAYDVCDDGLDGDCVGGDRPCHGSLSGLHTLESSDAGRANLPGNLTRFRDVADAGDVDGDGAHDLLATDGYSAWWLPGPVQGEVDFTAEGVQLTGLCCAGKLEADGVGDLDADGHDDLVVTDYSHAPDHLGAAYVVYGPLGGGPWVPADADATISGETAYGQLGIAVSGGWDASGDGVPDFALGADEARTSGAVYLFTDAVSGSLTAADATAILYTSRVGEQAGFDVDLEGDLDADGLADLVIGTQTGRRAYLVRGPLQGVRDLSTAEAVLTGPTGGSTRRLAVHAGDVDGDGHGDVLAGDEGLDSDGDGAAEGAAMLVLGPVSGIVDLDLADAILLGHRPGECTANTLSAAGDLDGDGFDDVLVGSPCATVQGETGLVAIVLGPVAGTLDLDLADGRLYGDEVGEAFAPAGDVDLDGYDDLLIGAVPTSTGDGAVSLVFGAPF